MVSHAGLAGAGRSGGAVWAAVEAHHLPQAAIVVSSAIIVHLLTVLRY